MMHPCPACEKEFKTAKGTQVHYWMNHKGNGITYEEAMASPKHPIVDLSTIGKASVENQVNNLTIDQVAQVVSQAPGQLINSNDLVQNLQSQGVLDKSGSVSYLRNKVNTLIKQNKKYQFSNPKRGYIQLSGSKIITTVPATQPVVEEIIDPEIIGYQRRLQRKDEVILGLSKLLTLAICEDIA